MILYSMRTRYLAQKTIKSESHQDICGPNNFVSVEDLEIQLDCNKLVEVDMMRLSSGY